MQSGCVQKQRTVVVCLKEAVKEREGREVSGSGVVVKEMPPHASALGRNQTTVRWVR